MPCKWIEACERFGEGNMAVDIKTVAKKDQRKQTARARAMTKFINNRLSNNDGHVRLNRKTDHVQIVINCFPQPSVPEKKPNSD